MLLRLYNKRVYGMKKIEFTKEQLEKIIKLYTQDKWGMNRIAQHMGNYSKPVIKRVLKEHKVEIDTPGQRYRGGRKMADKRYQGKNKEHLREYQKQWYQDNKEHRKQYHKEWRENNEEYRGYRRQYEKNKKDTDPSYKLACYTRTAIYTCLKERDISKYQNTFELLPYTLENLIEHLESQFQDNMSWDNYGDWHVDHKKPMVSFNIESPNDTQFQECWSLENLQPLWAEDNLSKGSRYL